MNDEIITLLNNRTSFIRWCVYFDCCYQTAFGIYVSVTSENEAETAQRAGRFNALIEPELVLGHVVNSGLKAENLEAMDKMLESTAAYLAMQNYVHQDQEVAGKQEMIEKLGQSIDQSRLFNPKFYELVAAISPTITPQWENIVNEENWEKIADFIAQKQISPA